MPPQVSTRRLCRSEPPAAWFRSDAPHGRPTFPESIALSNFLTETVLEVRHWTDTLFSFSTTRDPSLRFRNGEFIMMGLQIGERPLLRAYSLASANYEDKLQFFSIKV